MIWVTGFIWGSIAFMTSSLKRIARIPHFSSNPAVSFPSLVLWPVLVYLLARSFLKRAADEPAPGLKLGLTFSVVNFVLDLDSGETEQAENTTKFKEKRARHNLGAQP